jgi:predicted amidohydrolase
MNSKRLTISLGQFDVCWGNPDHNLGRVRELIQEAAARQSDVLILPELWDTGFDLASNVELGTHTTEGRFAEVAALAQQYQIHIIGSMLELGYPQGTSRPCYNTAMWFGADGSTPGSYRKIHLFRPLEEDQYLLPGGQPHWLDLPWGRSALAICYDLRFPELFRSYRGAGVEIMFLPAQWPKPRLAHWQTLLRARAIENQMVVVACNRVGHSGGFEHFGHSAIIDAWGETIIEGGEAEELLTAEVDLSHVAQIREKWPVFEDRRPDFYECI